MNAPYLSRVLREKADTLQEQDPDAAELLRVLARVVMGRPLADESFCAFGRPGDWGYDNPIGAALAGKVDPKANAHPEQEASL
jgi:hypothetical protein